MATSENSPEQSNQISHFTLFIPHKQNKPSSSKNLHRIINDVGSGSDGERCEIFDQSSNEPKLKWTKAQMNQVFRCKQMAIITRFFREKMSNWANEHYRFSEYCPRLVYPNYPCIAHKSSWCGANYNFALLLNAQITKLILDEAPNIWMVYVWGVYWLKCCSKYIRRNIELENHLPFPATDNLHIWIFQIYLILSTHCYKLSVCGCVYVCLLFVCMCVVSNIKYKINYCCVAFFISCGSSHDAIAEHSTLFISCGSLKDAIAELSTLFISCGSL